METTNILREYGLKWEQHSNNKIEECVQRTRLSSESYANHKRKQMQWALRNKAEVRIENVELFCEKMGLPDQWKSLVTDFSDLMCLRPVKTVGLAEFTDPNIRLEYAVTWEPMAKDKIRKKVKKGLGTYTRFSKELQIKKMFDEVGAERALINHLYAETKKFSLEVNCSEGFNQMVERINKDFDLFLAEK